MGNINLLISPTYSLGGAGVIDALPMAHHCSILSRRNVNKHKIKVVLVVVVAVLVVVVVVVVVGILAD